MKSLLQLFFTALQFLTRVPVPARDAFTANDLAKSFPFFPLVGLLVAAGGLVLRFVLASHASRAVVVVLLLLYLLLITGALHEDALADAADGFGGGWDKEKILSIMRDSRIGSYGAIAISLSLLARFVFLTELAPEKFAGYFIAGQVLSRWTAIPLCFWLPSARPGPGQGALVARKISWVALLSGTLLAGAITAAVLKYGSFCAGFSAVLVAAITGLYYRKRIGGITGDCFGATIQLAEIGVYLTGVIVRS
jgi:adenosylcobinamide-GDP ribazoletransferase